MREKPLFSNGNFRIKEVSEKFVGMREKPLFSNGNFRIKEVSEKFVIILTQWQKRHI